MKKSMSLAGTICAVVTIFGVLLIAPPVVAQTPPSAAASSPVILSVHVTSLRNAKGMAIVALHNTDKGFQNDVAVQSKTVDLSKSLTGKARDITVTFLGVAPGTYAVSILHDENNNNKVDTHWYKKPKEGVAVSNNPRPKMRAPRWSEAKFDIPATGKDIEIAVWYP